MSKEDTLTAVMSTPVTGQALVEPALFERLVNRIAGEHDLERGLAERIMDQALAFLAACARNTGSPLAPSELVDIGWHTFVLHTRDYAAFCERIAGRFLHHVPTEDHDPAASGEAARGTMARTVAAIEDAGFTLDLELWPSAAQAGCTGCHNGCHDDPPPARH
ncbi:glycine-rich domain-containing protein [Amycolatopsis thermoflava]|uniref:glycine-rich domain-containing protein n=1 Tax=Amycolatopsis thermoflava TaxID=84480 RepID=UPI0037FCF0F8